MFILKKGVVLASGPMSPFMFCVLRLSVENIMVRFQAGTFMTHDTHTRTDAHNVEYGHL